MFDFLKIVLFPETRIRKQVIINSIFPSNKAETTEIFSKFRKGYYLVSAIVHHITPSMYLNNFEFVKMRVEE